MSNTQEMLRVSKFIVKAESSGNLLGAFTSVGTLWCKAHSYIDGRNLSLFIGKKKLGNLTDIEEEVLSCKTTFSFSMACVVDAR